MWARWQTISPKKHDSSREESLSSLPEGEWAVAESQRGMTQDEVKIVCRRATPWKTDIFLRARVELFTGGWVSCSWVPKRDDAGWSENCMPKCNALKNGHLSERKGSALYRRVSELLLSSKEGWRRMKWKLYAEEQRREKRTSSWEEGLSSLLEGEWAVAESQRGMTQKMRRITTRKTKGIEKESVNIFYLMQFNV